LRHLPADRAGDPARGEGGLNRPVLDTAITRREFLGGTAGLTFAFALGGGFLGRAADALGADTGVRMNAWVTIGTDETVTILLPGAEMGQGIMTSLPLILAEELDADWSKVRVEYAPPIPKIYGNYHPLFDGIMLTAASVSVPGYYLPLRMAGAQARRVLIDSVAQRWNVPAAELRTESGRVIQDKTGLRITYGEIAKFTPAPAVAPKITEADLKKPADFRLVGRKDVGRIDVPSKVNGSAKYGIDAQVPGMVYAAILESPMEGAKAEHVNAADAMKVPGVSKVIPLPFGVVVIGSTVEATHAGRAALKVTWNTAGTVASKFDSEKAKAEYARHGRDPNAKALDWFKKGDAAASLRGAAKQLEAAYWSEHCYHAQMEPMNCIARVGDDGKSAEIWVGTQSTALAAFIASTVLKTTPDKIRVHQHLLGGGYGRRIAPDVIVQAVVIANVTKQTVKLMLKREDDLDAARPRPMTHHILRAGLDAGGNLVGWHHRLVAENVDAIAAPPRFKATGGKDLIGWRGMELPHYAIPNVLADAVREIHDTRVQPWRGIGAGYNKFAVESFLDEIAHAKGVDPLALRLELTRGDPRVSAVIRAAAEMADWKRKRSGRGLGFAFSEYHDSLSAAVAEVSVNRRTGRIKVHNYWVAVDPGRVIQPDHVLAQLEGGVAYGLSAALIEELTIKDGATVQSNFHDYRVLRMSDMPEIHTRIVESDNPPTGMGEIGVVGVAPAIGNAVFQLTGKRLRSLPMSPARVKSVLA
jgi:isoquinoline 1-oxidoreductase beta subunit